MKVGIVIAVVIVVLVVVYFVGVAPMMRAGAERSALESMMSAKGEIPKGSNVTPLQVGEFSATQQLPPKAPLSIDIRDAAAVYSGPGGELYFYHARTTEWGRQEVDHPGIMQSTSRALADVASGGLLRLDVEGHPVVRAQLRTGKWCYCWMNLDNLFCVVAPGKEAARAFIEAYPY